MQDDEHYRQIQCYTTPVANVDEVSRSDAFETLPSARPGQQGASNIRVDEVTRDDGRVDDAEETDD